MSKSLRFVLDTNVLISAVLSPTGQARRAFDEAVRHGRLLFSESTHAELQEVLARERIQKYLPKAGARHLLLLLEHAAEYVEPDKQIRACRDPKDDKFLEVAVSGGADVLVTGDKDLLVLHPFRDVPILTPAAFLEHVDR